jgi:serralysin
MFGGKNDDNMRAGGGDDFVSGQVGNDPRVEGGRGDDAHRGGDGDDIIYAQDGESDNLVSGGSGTDTCFFDPGLDQNIRECEIQNPPNP